MTEERQKEVFGLGWDAFWKDIPLDKCPDFTDEKERDEWSCGWLTAQSAELQDPYAHL